ncbi:MAG: RNA polymerase factor sigma-54, partial [Clostridia bacterium]|nr:RNA polymerase factor sigma-54 [Clostridia bacterium]
LSAVQIQSLELLTLNYQELDDYLERQLLENPGLENVVDDQSDHGAEGTADRPADGESTAAAGESGSFDAFTDDYYVPVGSYDADIASSERIGSLAHYDGDLSHHLLLQLSMNSYPPELRRAINNLIRALDEDGYLRIPLAEIAADLQLPEEVLEQALSEVQKLDPPGVGARSLVECLCLQGPLRHPERDLIVRVISDHLSDLAAGRFRSVSRELGVSEGKLRRILDYVRTLEPRPAQLAIGDEQPAYIVPDIIVRWVENSWRVWLTGSRRHNLRISAYYQEMMTQGDANKEAQDYLKQKITDARQLIRNMDRRRETIIKVATIMVRRQEGFLNRGLEELQPLTLKQVADEAGLHESTVCRAVSGKYVDTPRGVYPVRFFFSRSYSGEDGRNYSGAYVRSLIASLVAAEDKSSPLSDRQIEEALRARGVPVARRTVAKYRDEMGLPKKSFRRR